MIYAHVVNDGGFSFGMDNVTPVTWRFAPRRLTRNIYRSWTMPPYMFSWAKANPNWIGSYNDLQRIADSLRNA